MLSPRFQYRARIGRLVEAAVWLLIAGVFWQTWCVDGLIVPCRVASGSMAPCLLGPHRRVVCADCGYAFDHDGADDAAGRRAVCPLCGFADNPLKSWPPVGGDRIVIHKSIFALRPPRRWEVVAFRHPARASEIVVKRVVGLPGESVQVLGGDVYVDGQIQRKTFEQQQALAILVDDADRHLAQSPSPPPRWIPEGAWGAARGRFAHPASGPNEPVDWLVYRHWRRPAGAGDTIEEGAVTDICGQAQSRSRREEDVHRVVDLMLSLRLVEATGPGWLILRATDGREQFDVRLNPKDGRYQVLQNDQPVPAAQGRLPGSTRGLRVVVSLFDRQFLLALDGRPVVTWPYEPSDRPLTTPSRPLAVGAQGPWVVIEELKVYRDVYYTTPIGHEQRAGLAGPVTLGEGADAQYYVLGDWSFISEDSRNWSAAPGLPGRLIVGKPLIVLFPPKPVSLGRWSIQIPDISRIRYIR